MSLASSPMSDRSQESRDRRRKWLKLRSDQKGSLPISRENFLSFDSWQITLQQKLESTRSYVRQDHTLTRAAWVCGTPCFLLKPKPMP